MTETYEPPPTAGQWEAPASELAEALTRVARRLPGAVVAGNKFGNLYVLDAHRDYAGFIELRGGARIDLFNHPDLS